MNLRWRWATAIVIIISCVAGFFWLRTSRAPLPDVEEIESIVAGSDYGKEGEWVTFDVAIEHWPKIKSALEPARRDYEPAKWVHKGSLEITLRDGGHYHVSLYDLPIRPGAFSSGPSFDRRVYYRGGDSAELARGMSAALTTAREQGKVHVPEK